MVGKFIPPSRELFPPVSGFRAQSGELAARGGGTSSPLSGLWALLCEPVPQLGELSSLLCGNFSQSRKLVIFIHFCPPPGPGFPA